jgi:hypothetical protein
MDYIIIPVFYRQNEEYEDQTQINAEVILKVGKIIGSQLHDMECNPYPEISIYYNLLRRSLGRVHRDHVVCPSVRLSFCVSVRFHFLVSATAPILFIYFSEGRKFFPESSKGR